MKATLNDWNNGWFGVSLGVAAEEIDRLIDSLRQIKTDPSQHFHISSDYKGIGGLGDIEVYVREEDEKDNLFLSSLALGPGDVVKTDLS